MRQLINIKMSGVLYFSELADVIFGCDVMMYREVLFFKFCLSLWWGEILCFVFYVLKYYVFLSL